MAREVREQEFAAVETERRVHFKAEEVGEKVRGQGEMTELVDQRAPALALEVKGFHSSRYGLQSHTGLLAGQAHSKVSFLKL